MGGSNWDDEASSCCATPLFASSLNHRQASISGVRKNRRAAGVSRHGLCAAENAANDMIPPAAEPFGKATLSCSPADSPASQCKPPTRAWDQDQDHSSRPYKCSRPNWDRVWSGQDEQPRQLSYPFTYDLPISSARSHRPPSAATPPEPNGLPATDSGGAYSQLLKALSPTDGHPLPFLHPAAEGRSCQCSWPDLCAATAGVELPPNLADTVEQWGPTLATWEARLCTGMYRPCVSARDVACHLWGRCRRQAAEQLRYTTLCCLAGCFWLSLRLVARQRYNPSADEVRLLFGMPHLDIFEVEDQLLEWMPDLVPQLAARSQR